MPEMSKKELKEMRKLEEARRSTLEKKANMTKWIAIGAISTIFLGFFLFLVISLRNNNPDLSNPNTTTVELSDSGNFRVAEDSTTPAKERPVTLTEFADIQCPACKQYQPIIKSVLDLYPETVALNFKHFPISSIHPNANQAAIVAEAANEQGKFFEMVDLLYERQEAWASLPDPSETFLKYAQEIGLDLTKFKADIENAELARRVESQRTEGINAGVNSTPSFFVNGVKIQNPSDISGFQAAIEAVLAGVTDNSTSPAPQNDLNSTPSAEPSVKPGTPQINL